MSHFIHLKFPIISSTAAHVLVEMYACVENLQNGNFDRNTSFCDETLPSRRRSPVGANQPEMQTQCDKSETPISVPLNYIDFRVTWKLGDEGTTYNDRGLRLMNMKKLAGFR